MVITALARSELKHVRSGRFRRGAGAQGRTAADSYR